MLIDVDTTTTSNYSKNTTTQPIDFINKRREPPHKMLPQNKSPPQSHPQPKHPKLNIQPERSCTNAKEKTIQSGGFAYDNRSCKLPHK
jgi:hypothetical protein